MKMKMRDSSCLLTSAERKKILWFTMVAKKSSFVFVPTSVPQKIPPYGRWTWHSRARRQTTNTKTHPTNKTQKSKTCMLICSMIHEPCRTCVPMLIPCFAFSENDEDDVIQTLDFGSNRSSKRVLPTYEL